MSSLHILEPGQPVRLSEVPTAPPDIAAREEARAEFRELRAELVDWQRKLYAEGLQKLLIVFQAMDAGGKDGTIKAVFSRLNPQGVRVESFKKPSEDELAHDFLWRVHKVVPPAGHITVFNRSHYGDVLVVRVEDLAPETVWRPRFQQINEFERMLVESGTHILKFYLHISKEEQRRRFLKRIHDPKRQWKFKQADIDKRRDWEAYMVAYEETLERCTTSYAPWHVVPSDLKWYRNLVVMRAIVGRLRTMNPEYPPHGFDPETVEID